MTITFIVREKIQGTHHHFWRCEASRLYISHELSSTASQANYAASQNCILAARRQ